MKKRMGTKIEIVGCPPDIEYPEVVRFLNSGMDKTFRFNDLSINPPIVWVENKDVEEILKLNGKEIRPGHPLTFVIQSVVFEKKLSPGARDALKRALVSRWEPNKRLLNLAGLARNDEFNFHNVDFVKDLGTLVKSLYPTVVGLNFADNKIQSLQALQRLPPSAPHVKIIGLMGNHLSKFSELNHIATAQWKESLKNLSIQGNPFANGLEVFITGEVTSRFPRLETLDEKPIRPLIKFAVQSQPVGLPVAMPHFYENNSIEKHAKEFVGHFYEAFDAEDTKHRSKLQAFYTDQSCFSISIPNTTRALGAGYLSLNRNLVEEKGDGSVSLLKVGWLGILWALSNFPKTKHEGSSFVLDAAVVPAGTIIQRNQLLHIGIRGRFTDVSNSSYAFHRTFILSQSTRNAKFPILNDQLTILPMVTPNIGGRLLRPGDITVVKKLMEKLNNAVDLWQAISALDKAKGNLDAAIAELQKTKPV
jgi:hypothetical protein